MKAGKYCLLSMSCALFLVGGLPGCSVDDGGDGEDPVRTDVTRIPGDPAADALLDDEGIVCQSELTVSGILVPGEAPPPGETGCWGVGEWRVTGEVSRKGCEPQPEVPDFVYVATREDDSTVLRFPSEPDNERLNIKIAGSAAGCTGQFEHFELDFSVWALKAVLQDDNTITGTGTYSVYNSDPI